MNKTILVTALLFSIVSTYSQDDKDSNLKFINTKNDLKINAYFTALGLFELTYERNLNENSSVGIVGLYAYNQNHDEDVNYQISPFYRRYFGKKFASGFFVEGFTTFGSVDGKQLYDVNGNLTLNEGPDVHDLSIGASFGYKWVTKSGLVFEALFGLGGNLFNAAKTDHNIINRRALSIGYRF